MLNKNSRVLITGGAGYLGSFMVKLLGEKGLYPISLDDLSNGYKKSVLYGDFIEGDIADKDLVKKIIKKYEIKSVIHFAGFANVKESIEKPQMYMKNNFEKSKILFETCYENGVKRIIFSSSCSVYGIPKENPIDENTQLSPISPYGESKKKAEEKLIDIYKNTNDKRYAILRYFNVAGADIKGKIGEMNAKNGRLIKIAAEVVSGKRDKLFMFGDDYPTPDGTAIRDFIHVQDLVLAHWDVLNYLEGEGKSDVFNIGYGKGYSVLEIINKTIELSPKKIEVVNAKRRIGDPACLIADSTKIKSIVGWKPEYNDINKIVQSALNWEMKLNGEKS